MNAPFFSLITNIISGTFPSLLMSCTRNQYLFLALCLCILLSAIFMITTKKTVSAEEAVQIALNDSAVRNLIGGRAFSIGGAQLHQPQFYKPNVSPPAEVWAVPVTVCYDTFEYGYRVEITREGTLYGIPRPSHISYPPPEHRDIPTGVCDRVLLVHAPTITISREAAVQVVLQDPTVIQWINNGENNTDFQVQDVYLENFSVVGKPQIPLEDRWVVPLLMHINNITYHYTIEVGMNGTIMYRSHPRTLYPPPPANIP